jgi:DNA-binding MarR family transcriptional regulator
MTTTNPSPTTKTVPSADLAARLRLVVTRLARQLRQRAVVDLSPSQISALATIERGGPVTLGELAALEHVQPPSVTVVVTRLEEKGLVIRRQDPRDRRVVRVETTKEGRRLARTRSWTGAFVRSPTPTGRRSPPRP